MILVDTSVIIDFLLRRQNEATAKCYRVLEQATPFGITACVMQEVLQGAKSERDFDVLHDYLSTQKFYAPLEHPGSYAEAARLFMKCSKKGLTVRSSVDCLIARVAIEHDLYLLHNDRGFEAIAEVAPLKML
jgi:predicted nucleic acid-binding protein